MALKHDFRHASPPTGWSWIEIQGADALDFLHRLSTVNIKKLKADQGSRGFFLTPQGKPLAYFKLWMLKEGHYAFEFDSGNEEKWRLRLLETLERFHFGEAVSWKERSDLECLWLFPEQEDTPDTSSFPGCSLHLQGLRQFGRPWVALWGSATAIQGVRAGCGEEIGAGQLLQWRIEAMAPAVDHEILETTLPLEVGLGDALAEDKGCYPGQEVIERIRSQGAPPRQMVLLRGEGFPPPSPCSLLNETNKIIGALTSYFSIESTGRWAGLGLVQKQFAQPGLKVSLAGCPARGEIETLA